MKQIKEGDFDVLIGTRAISTGVDGLQNVISRMIINLLPETFAEWKQLLGRLFRIGQHNHVDVVVPMVYYWIMSEDNNKSQKSSRDEDWMKRIFLKRSIADKTVDGEWLPPSIKEEREQYTRRGARKNLMKIVERIDAGGMQHLPRKEMPSVYPLDSALPTTEGPETIISRATGGLGQESEVMPMNGQKRKRTSVNAGNVLNPKRPMTEAEKAEYQKRRQRHLDAQKDAAKLDIYFRYDRPGSKLKEVIDDITHWQLKNVDGDLKSWESQLSEDSPLLNTLKELRNTHLKWLRWLYFRAACKLRMDSGGLGPKPSEWPGNVRGDLRWETCTQWIHSAGSHGSGLGAGYLTSLLRNEQGFVDICAIAATNEQNAALLQTFTDAVDVITADYNIGLSKWG